MDEILSLLRCVIGSDTGKTVLRDLLNACSEQLSLKMDPSKIPSLVSLINSKLNEPSSRYDGLLLLVTFLPHCSLEILSSNASTWMQLCIKGLAAPQTSTLAFEVLKTFFKLTRDLPEMTKIISATIVPALAEQLNRDVWPQSLLPALECLEECFDKYNGPCGPHKKVWDRFLIPLVDFSGPQASSVIRQAGRCMAALPQIGGGGTGGTMYACNWFEQQKIICRSIHVVLDELFSDVNEIQVFQPTNLLEGVEPLPLRELEYSNPIQQVQMLTSRLSGLVIYLQRMLLGKFPAPKKIAISTIFNLVCRGLAVSNASFSSSTTTHSLALVSMLPKVHIALLDLLNCLIVVCQSNMLPFSALICKLAVQTLKWTWVKKWPYGTEKPYCSLRIQAYKLVNQWCGMARRGSLIEDVADQLTEMAISDCFMEQDSVVLTTDLSRRNKYANRKQAKQSRTFTPGSTSSMANGHEHHVDVGPVSSTANEGLCTAALQALRAIFSTSSSVISPTAHKMLQEAVCSSLVSIIRNSANPPIPYSSNSARLELYQTLLALVLNPHPVWPPPYGLAVKMFAAGLNDKDFQVSVFCCTAQSAIEKIIHPSHASLHFQVPVEEIVDTARNIERQNTISEISVHRSLSEKSIDDWECMAVDEDTEPSVSKQSSSVKKTPPRQSINMAVGASPNIVVESPATSDRSLQISVAVMQSPTTSDKDSTYLEDMNKDLKSPVKSTSPKSMLDKSLHRSPTPTKRSIPDKPPSSNKCVTPDMTPALSVTRTPDKSPTPSTKSLSPNKSASSKSYDVKHFSPSSKATTEASEVNGHTRTQDSLDGNSYIVDLADSDSELDEALCGINVDESDGEKDSNSSGSLCSLPSSCLNKKKKNSPKPLLTISLEDVEDSDCVMLGPKGKTSPVQAAKQPEQSESKFSPPTASTTSAGYRSPVRDLENSSKISPVLTPRVLRSRTISNSSGASTPGKKKIRHTSSLTPTEELEEIQECEDKHEEPQSKKSKFDDDDLDKKLEAMLSSFVDVTQDF